MCTPQVQMQQRNGQFYHKVLLHPQRDSSMPPKVPASHPRRRHTLCRIYGAACPFLTSSTLPAASALPHMVRATASRVV